MNNFGKAVEDLRDLKDAVNQATEDMKIKDFDLKISRHHLEVLVKAAEGILSDTRLALDLTK